MVRVVLNIVFLAFISSIILADDACKYTSSDGTIDISSLAGPGDSPQYKDVQAVGSGWKYSFNPCKPFNEGASCRGASVCQVNGDGSDQYMLGTQGSAVWIPPPGAGSTPTLKFSYQNPTDLKQVTMNLFCPQDGEAESFDFLMESPSNNYQFNWKNKCLCWNGCKGVGPTPGGGGGGITGGEVFLIILFASLFIYFVVFVLINRFARQQTGLDVLPHRGFWGALFGYTKDGVMFLVSRVTGKGGNYQSV